MTIKCSQNKMAFALAKIFASEARVAVLRLFLIDPCRAYYQRQIETATGLPIRAIQRELGRLTSINFLYRHEEGNRCYYQVDTQFILFSELRAIFLKTSSDIDNIRGQLATVESVQLSIYFEEENRLLVVTHDEELPELTLPESYKTTVMSSNDFSKSLIESPERVEPYLLNGVDILGRRSDIIWRHIESAGYSVERGKGVP